MNPLKIALEITPNLEPLFGTRDENLRLMEDSLGVRIDLRSDAVHVEGPEEGVVRVRRIFEDFEALRRQGINPHNGELNGMLRLVVADTATTLRSVAEAGKQRSAGIKRTVQPRSLNQRRYVEAIEQNDMVFGVGPAGTGKTYLAVAMAVAAINAKKRQPDCVGAPRGGGRRAAGLFAGHACRRRSIPICARSTTRSTTCSTLRRWTRCWSAT